MWGHTAAFSNQLWHVPACHSLVELNPRENITWIQCELHVCGTCCLSSDNWHLGCFHVFAIVKWCGCEHGYTDMPWSPCWLCIDPGTPGTHGDSKFNFWRSCSAPFPAAAPEAPNLPHTHWPLSFLSIFFVSHLKEQRGVERAPIPGFTPPVPTTVRARPGQHWVLGMQLGLPPWVAAEIPAFGASLLRPGVCTPIGRSLNGKRNWT